MSWLGDAWDSVKEVVSDGADAIVGAVDDVVEDIVDAAEDWADDVTDIWSNATRHGTTFLGIVGGLIGMLGSTIDFVFDVVGAVVGGIVTASIDIVGVVVGMVVSIFNPAAGPKVARAIYAFGKQAGAVVARTFDIIGNVVEWAFGLVASGFFWLGSWIVCARGRVTGGKPRPRVASFDGIDHFVVLMLENHSFDQMLGHVRSVGDLARPLSNRDLDSRDVYTSPNALLKLDADPPHSFHAVDRQTNGGAAMTGFAQVWHEHLKKVHAGDEPGRSNIEGDLRAPSTAEIAQVMAGFAEDKVPIVTSLAREFAVCDRWFASVPGPTYPNRLFAYAGTSGGLAGDPDTLSLIGSYGDGIGFDADTLFQRLERKCVAWRVYHGDAFPMSSTLSGMSTSHVGDHRSINPDDPDGDDYTDDLSNADESFPSFVFIEPNYGQFWASSYSGGNSQHPWSAISPGERLIKHVYERLRASPIWERSALILLYDEHGGFYDHMVPPAAVPPGDTEWHDNLNPVSVHEPQPSGFGFDRLGVRVPAVVVSPLIPSGTVLSEVCDHTTIIRTICDRFGLGSLTARDASAYSLRPIFSLSAPRATPATLPRVYTE